MKISFINAVARVCDLVGADVTRVAEGMGYDDRIGKKFLKAGLGFGGSCFPKDLNAYVKMAERAGYNFELLRAVQKINAEQRDWAVNRLKKALWNLKGKQVAVLGLAFKPNTDDLRNAPSLEIIERLRAEGCRVSAYDPVAVQKAKPLLKGVRLTANPYQAVRGADAVLVATEWDEVKELDLQRVRKLVQTPVLLDGRNIFDPKIAVRLGFSYHGIGRPTPS